MTQRDWKKDMDLVQGTIKHDAFPAWTEPMLYWLQEAKERGEREQRLKEALEELLSVFTLHSTWASVEDYYGSIYSLTDTDSEIVLRINSFLSLYPDTPAPKEGSR
ncbi:hypothetical protein MHH60_26255 [Paenibacillus sp. FSL H7-0716]|uniref:CdiI immunity protein domain-containing protein n=1 Tax=Paenibacillus odorifer TaxID=189426 RepID=A0AB36J2Z3_9BACL|nr:hypothetical protein [Paenibacillus odorifer]OME08881.1 hypothetical protein BSK47_32155 [Paenibacillus odorifer]